MRARGGCAATQFELMLAESRVTTLIHQTHSELQQPKSPVPHSETVGFATEAASRAAYEAIHAAMTGICQGIAAAGGRAKEATAADLSSMYRLTRNQAVPADLVKFD